MNQANFSISYKGKATEGGEIDVKDLSESLFSLGEVVDTMNLLYNGETSKTNLKVKAFSKGSFCVDLLTFQDIATGVLLSGLINAQDIVSLIFGEFGLIYFIKQLAGRKIQHAQKEQDEVVIETEDGDILRTSVKVFGAYNNISITNNITKVVSPLRKEDIDSIEVKGDYIKNPELIKKEDIKSFVYPSDVKKEETTNTTYDTYLSIISVVFKEDNKWRFSDGTNSFYATMKDYEFLEKVYTKKLSFTNGDKLFATIHLSQLVGSDGSITTEYSILKVRDYIPSYKQGRLNLE